MRPQQALQLRTQRGIFGAGPRQETVPFLRGADFHRLAEQIFWFQLVHVLSVKARWTIFHKIYFRTKEHQTAPNNTKQDQRWERERCSWRLSVLVVPNRPNSRE